MTGRAPISTSTRKVIQLLRSATLVQPQEDRSQFLFKLGAFISQCLNFVGELLSCRGVARSFRAVQLSCKKVTPVRDLVELALYAEHLDLQLRLHGQRDQRLRLICDRHGLVRLLQPMRHLSTQRTPMRSRRCSQLVFELCRQPEVGLHIFSTHAPIIKQSACKEPSTLLHYNQAQCYTKESMKHPTVQTNVRLPKSLKSWLVARAATHRRSLTGEIVVHLEAAKEAEAGAAKGDGEVIEPTSPSVNTPKDKSEGVHHE